MKTILTLLLATVAIGASAQERSVPQDKKITFNSTAYVSQKPNNEYIEPLPTYNITDASEKKYPAHGSNPGGVIFGNAAPDPALSIKLIDLDYPSRYVFTKTVIYQMPIASINDLLATLPGTYQARRGDNVSFTGSMPGGNLIYIDGRQVMTGR